MCVSFPGWIRDCAYTTCSESQISICCTISRGDFAGLSLEISIQLFFFLLLFTSFCCSLDYGVVCVVSGRCNQSFFAFLYSPSLHIDASTLSSILATPLPPFFLDTYSLSMSSSLVSLFSICWSSSLVHFKIGIGLLLLELFTSALADGFSLEFGLLQVSRTLLSILAFLNNVLVWMVSIRPPTSKSSSPFNNPLVTVPNAPITIGV